MFKYSANSIDLIGGSENKEFSSEGNRKSGSFSYNSATKRSVAFGITSQSFNAFNLTEEGNVNKSQPPENELTTEYLLFQFTRDYSESSTRGSSKPQVTTAKAHNKYIENKETISSKPILTETKASMMSTENKEIVPSKPDVTLSNDNVASYTIGHDETIVTGMEGYTFKTFNSKNSQRSQMLDDDGSQMTDQTMSREDMDCFECPTKKTDRETVSQKNTLFSSPAAYSVQVHGNLTETNPLTRQPPTIYTSISNSVPRESINSSSTSLAQTANSTVTVKPTVKTTPLYVTPLAIATGYAVRLSALVVSPFSLVTNGLSMCVFIRVYTRKQNIITILIILCVVDTLALAKRFSFFVQAFSHWSVLPNDVGCKGLYWVMNVSQDWSSWLSVIYTVERFISVRWPMKVKVICSRKRILVAIVMSLMVSCLMEVYQILLRVGNSFSCTIKQQILYSTIYLGIHSIIGMLLPYAVIAVLNALIIFNLIKQRSEHGQITSGGNSARENQRQRSLTITLVSASTYSVVVNIPMFIAIIGDSTLGFSIQVSGYDWRAIFSTWANDVISSWNYCGLFFFCVLAGKTFRQEFVRMVTCAKKESLGMTFHPHRTQWSLYKPKVAWPHGSVRKPFES